MESLCSTVRRFDYGAGYKIPQILIVSPAHIGEDMEHCPFAGFDHTAPSKSRSLAPLYEEVAKAQGCMFLDASVAAKASPLDQLHLDAKNHIALAEGIMTAVKSYFEP